MNKFLNNLKSGLTIGLGFLVMVIIGGIVYGSLSQVEPGDTLSASKWNEIVNTMNGLQQATPSGAVIAFNLKTCPVGWLPANGNGSIAGENIPDLRGEFIRGLDNGRGIDINRVLGSNQEDMFKSHSHNLKTGYRLTTSPGGAKAFYNDYPDEYTTTYETGGSETRPRNIALLYCIKE